MTRGTSFDIAAGAGTSEVAIVDGKASKRVKLLPIGSIVLRDKRGPFIIRDRAHAERVVAATRQWLGSSDFNFDYGHAVRRDDAAIAAGWAPNASLSVEDDGIYADVEWTEAAAAKIAAREYRYLSPLFTAAPSGDVLQLKNAALVNIAAIDLPAIAAGYSEEESMDLTAIAAALGLAATATAEEIAAAAADLKAKSAAPATSAIAIAAGLAATAGVEEIAASVAGLKAGQADPAKFVPVENVLAMQAQISTLSNDLAEREVAAAIKIGKLAPALKDWGLNKFKTDKADWDKFIGAAPVIVAAGVEIGGGGDLPPGNADKLTEQEVAACALMGVSEEAYLAEKKLAKGGAA